MLKFRITIPIQACVYAFILICQFDLTALAQEDRVGSGHALKFDGVDDYVSLGDVYDNLKLPLTLSAWVKMGTRPSAPPDVIEWLPVFTSQDREINFVSEGFWLILQPNIISTGYADGRGSNSAAFRRSKTVTLTGASMVDRWVMITVVLSGKTDMHIYLNGVDINGSYSGTSDFPMSATSLDIAMIGHHFSNGFQYWFVGEIDDVRLWSRALSQEEVRESMCHKLVGNESGLVGYWTFNETIGSIAGDASSTNTDGELRNGVQRLYSGAPIGDKSSYLYTSDWNGKEITLEQDGIGMDVKKIQGMPDGMQIYLVQDFPSQTDGVSATCTTQPYFGIFADASSEVQYSASLFRNEPAFQGAFARNDNSEPTWNLSSGSGDATDNGAILLEGVNRGEYLGIAKGQSPDLGPDYDFCKEGPKLVTPFENQDGYEYKWNDGSQTPTLLLDHPGLYWVTVSGPCGTATDSIRAISETYDSLFVPNIITPNGDRKNDFFEVDKRITGNVRLLVINRWGKEVFRSENYGNTWGGNDLPAGVYFYILTGNCIAEKKGVITIAR